MFYAAWCHEISENSSDTCALFLSPSWFTQVGEAYHVKIIIRYNEVTRELWVHRDRVCRIMHFVWRRWSYDNTFSIVLSLTSYWIVYSTRPSQIFSVNQEKRKESIDTASAKRVFNDDADTWSYLFYFSETCYSSSSSYPPFPPRPGRIFCDNASGGAAGPVRVSTFGWSRNYSRWRCLLRNDLLCPLTRRRIPRPHEAEFNARRVRRRRGANRDLESWKKETATVTSRVASKLSEKRDHKEEEEEE